jgi:hypothetical protein
MKEKMEMERYKRASDSLETLNEGYYLFCAGGFIKKD